MNAPARLHVADPLLELNLCDGTGVVPVILAADVAVGRYYRYDACPGCAGCDYDTVSARQSAKAPADPFARFPCDDDAAF